MESREFPLDQETSTMEENYDRNSYEKAIREIREKERELSKRTEMLETLVRNLSLTPSPETSPIRHNDATILSPPRLPTYTSTPVNRNNIQFNGESSTMSSATFPKSYLRDALELVPKYDGHNIPVWQFARACKRARESVPLVDEAMLVRMLRNKLSHHAYLAVEDETHHTVEQFLDSLKKIFGPGRNSNYYRGQLSMAYKKPTEHILDYIGRVKDLRTAILEGDQTTLDRSLTENEIIAIDSFALEAFYEGLPRECRIELRAEGYHGFSDACSKAVIIHKKLEREDARNRNVRRDAGPQGPSRGPQPGPATQSTNLTNAPAGAGLKVCNYCKKVGHLISECRRRQYNATNVNENKYQGNSNNAPAWNTGNQQEVSATGTSRGLGNARPIFHMEELPNHSTSSEQMMETSALSNFDHDPFEQEQHSCSIQEPNQIS